MVLITNRDMQNPSEPNLPFAQSFPIHVEAPIPINFGQGRPNPKYIYYEYIVNGDSWLYGKKVNERNFLRESTAQFWRSVYGYDVRKVSDTKLDSSGNPTGTTTTTTTTGSGTSGLTKSQVEKIIEEYHGDDISLLHSHAVDFGKQLTASKSERDRIETKLDKAKAEHQNIWDSLAEKSDVSHIHLPTWPNGNGNGNGCGTFDILCHIEKLKAQIGGVAIIGGVVLVGYFLLKRRIRK